MTALSERHAEAAAQLEQARRQRGEAVLDGVPYNGLSPEQLEAELDALHVAGDLETARRRQSEADAWAVKRDALIADLRRREQDRLDAVAGAEQALRDFVACYNDVLLAAADERRAISELGKSGLSMPVDGMGMTIRLGERASAVLAGIQRTYHQRFIQSAAHPTWRGLSDNWRDLEAGEMADNLAQITLEK